MEEALNDLKKVLRSLVVSSPVQVDVRSLLKDYREMVGGRLPIEQYGYRDPIKFLKERCSDSFQFQGPPNNPILILIVTDSIKHIDRFVRSQKVSSAAKVKGKRRSVLGTPGSLPKPPQDNLICRSFKSNNGRVPNSVERNSHPPRNPVDNRNHYKEQRESIISGIEERKVKEDKSKEIKAKSTPIDNLDRCSSSSGSLSRQQALLQVKANIKELVSSYPEGVWCTALLALYKERFGNELNFHKYGFTSLISLVLEVGNDIAVTRPNPSDWLLQPASALACKPMPQELQVLYVPWATRRLAAEQADEDALPGVPIEPGVFPEDCMQPLASIEGVGVEDVAEGDLLEVAVTEVYSPSRFWVQRLGERHNLLLEALMDEMDVYYRGEGAKRWLSVGAVRVGHHVACRFEGDWHRAVIVRLVDAGTVKVRHVDYGTVCAVSTAELRPLLRRFAALPAQATRAVMANVRPAAGGRRWPLASASFLLTLTRYRPLVGRVCAVCSASATLELELIDTSTDDDVYLAEQMLRAGHADHEPRSALASDECYLLPTFDALEGALTLHFSEINQCLRDGIDIEYLDEYRCHVAPLVPSSPPTSPPAAPASTSPPPTPPVSPPRADASLLSVVPLQLPLALSSPSPPSPTPLDRGLAPEVYKRFLALSMVDSTLANEYMVEEIMRTQVHGPAWSSSSVPSLEWNSSAVAAWSPSPSPGWGSGADHAPAWHGSFAPRTPWSLTPLIRPPPGFESKLKSTSGPTKWV